MKKLLLVIAFCLISSGAWAQCNGVFQPNTVCGNSGASPAPPGPASPSGFTGGNVSPLQVPQLPLAAPDIAASSSSNTQCLTSGGMQTPTWTTCQYGGQRNFLRNSSLVDSCQNNPGVVPAFGANQQCSITITTSGGWCAQGLYVIPVGDSVDCIWSGVGKGNGLFGPSVQLTGHAALTDLIIRFVQDSWMASQMSGQAGQGGNAGPFKANTVTFQMSIHNNLNGQMNPTIATAQATGAAGPDDFSSVAIDLPATPMQPCGTFSIFDVECLEAFTWTPNFNIQNGYEEIIDLHPTDHLVNSIWINPGFDLRVTPGAPTGITYNPPHPSYDPAGDHLLDSRYYQQFTGLLPLCFATGVSALTTVFNYPAMRATPTITFSSANALRANGGFSNAGLAASNQNYEAAQIGASSFAATTFTVGSLYACTIDGIFLDASLIGG